MINYAKQFALEGKVVFVAGGAGLIGAEICRAAASMNALVIALDTNASKGQALVEEIIKAGAQARFELFDVTDLPTVEHKMAELFARYGRMDAWINATYPRTQDWSKPLEAMTIEYLEGNVQMHLNSCIWTSRKAGILMREHKIMGSIITFGSIYGVQANDVRIYEGTAMTGEMIYCAIKGGIINMTRYLAAHFGPAGIRANSICPGGIWDHQDPAFVERYNSRVPLKRMGTPQDIAASAVFLVSEASSYVSGTTFMVDGGWTVV